MLVSASRGSFESAALTERSLYFPVSVNCSSAPNKASFYSNKGSDAYDLIQQHGSSFPSVCTHYYFYGIYLVKKSTTDHGRVSLGLTRDLQTRGAS